MRKMMMIIKEANVVSHTLGQALVVIDIHIVSLINFIIIKLAGSSVYGIS